MSLSHYTDRKSEDRDGYRWEPMRRNFHHRLARLEAKENIGPPKYEFWVSAGDGLVRNRDGRTMTQEAFDAAFPNARNFTLDIFGNSNRD